VIEVPVRQDDRGRARAAPEPFLGGGADRPSVAANRSIDEDPP